MVDEKCSRVHRWICDFNENEMLTEIKLEFTIRIVRANARLTFRHAKGARDITTLAKLLRPDEKPRGEG